MTVHEGYDKSWRFITVVVGVVVRSAVGKKMGHNGSFGAHIQKLESFPMSGDPIGFNSNILAFQWSQTELRELIHNMLALPQRQASGSE